MSRKNGTWSPIYGQAWCHDKTLKASAVVVEARHRRRYAPFLVLGWLNRLNLWCLSNNEEGIVANLSDVALAAVAWPEALEDGVAPARAGSLARSALRAGGFLEDSPSGERIHEFRAFHVRLLGAREYQRNRDDSSAKPSANSSAKPSAATSPEPDLTGIGGGMPPAPAAGEPRPAKRRTRDSGALVPIEDFPAGPVRALASAIRGFDHPAWSGDPKVTPAAVAALVALAPGVDAAAEARRAAAWWASKPATVRGRTSCLGTLRTWLSKAAERAPSSFGASPGPHRTGAAARLRAELDEADRAARERTS